jgi:hypothetical protein
MLAELPSWRRSAAIAASGRNSKVSEAEQFDLETADLMPRRMRVPFLRIAAGWQPCLVLGYYGVAGIGKDRVEQGSCLRRHRV